MNKRALLQIHAATVLFGLSAIFGRLISSSAATIVFGRAAFALVAITPRCFTLDVAPWRLGTTTIVQLLVTGAALAAHWVAFFAAVKTGGVAVATLGFASFPAFVAVLEAASFREKLTRREHFLIVLVSIGLVLVTPSFDFSDNATEGLLLGVLSGLLYAGIAVANRFSARTVPAMLASWWQYVAIVACLIPFAIAELPNMSRLDWLWLACLGLLCTALAYGLLIASLSALRARLAAIIISLEPVYAIAIAWWLFQETPSARMLAGGALIIGAVVRSAGMQLR